ncbi:MAG: ABC transporter ATP-binding protein, partial [Planctomycetia bacterium]|nr:ABC transporter ATP-binding protein [Planctomycetia bacterium]
MARRRPSGRPSRTTPAGAVSRRDGGLAVSRSAWVRFGGGDGTDRFPFAIGISCATAAEIGPPRAIGPPAQHVPAGPGYSGGFGESPPARWEPAFRMSILRAERLEKTFSAGDAGAAGVPAVRGIDLAIEAGEGSGKSTLLHMLGGITRPSAGRVLLEGVDLASLDDDALAVVRRRRIGFVFQRYNLLPELSLVENVALPLVLDGAARRRSDEAAREALEAVGMGHRAAHRPDELSGGEQQRGAIARALVTAPAIVLADEPTGALDSVNSARVVELLRDLVAARRQTVVLVTHDAAIAA